MTGETTATIGRLAYEKATHAPLHKRYRGGAFERVGTDPEPGKPWRIHEATGAEIHALGGTDHRYSTDLKVGSSYPATVFVFGDREGSTESASHEELEQFLRDHDLWSEKLHPVAVPNGGGEWRFGFQFRPPESAPYSLDGVAETVRETFDLDDHDILEGRAGFQAMLG